MKTLFMFLILTLCFIVIYIKLIRREDFYDKVKVVNSITDLKQEKVYIIQEKDAFFLDFEYYYYDYVHNNNDGKIYVMAENNLLTQILQKYQGTSDFLVLPSKVRFDDKGMSISAYDEIWRKEC